MNKKQKMRQVIKLLKKNYYTEHSLARNKFMLLIGTILSQRTRDENTGRALENLSSKAKTPEDILSLPLNKLEKLIKPSGMYKQKAKRIHAVTKIILEKYNGQVPKTREELLTLPGVGFKTAMIVLCYGYGKPVIPVDVHVAVTANRLGLTNSKDIEIIRKDLERVTPERYRHIINHGLVQFGKEICRTRNPKCDICPLKSICNYVKKYRKI